MSRPRFSMSLVDLFVYSLLALILAAFLFPFLWMFLSSLKPAIIVNSYPPVFIFKPTLQNYVDVFTGQPFLRYILNSTIIALGSVGIGLAVGLPAAYSIARYKQDKLAFVILWLRILPGIAFLVPMFIFYRRLGLIDTYGGMILSHLIVTLPMIVWISIGFFEDIPSELTDAALIDGCSKVSAFFRVVLPLSAPGVTAASILSFVYSWNNFMLVLVLGGSKTATLPLAAWSFISFEEINWGGLNAAAAVIMLPVLVLALVMQRYLAAGLTMGAVKG